MAHPAKNTELNTRLIKHSNINQKNITNLITLTLSYFLLLIPANYCDVNFQDSSLIKPNLLLVVPQTFKLANKDSLDSTYDLDGSNQHDIKQLSVDNYVAIVNNAPTDQLDRLIRKQFPRLVLQVRNLKHANRRKQQLGELVFEHVFDYFPEQTKEYNFDGIHSNNNDDSQQQQLQNGDNFTRSNNNFILIPINLDQVSHEHVLSNGGDSARDSNGGHGHSRTRSHSHTQQQHIQQQQQLVVSVRPYGNLDGSGGFGSDQIDLVSSVPISVETIQGRNGQRSFGIVQTDKPIYKPDENVRIRTLVVNEHLRPIGRDELRLQIRNPHKIIVEEVRFPRELELQKWAANPREKAGKYFFDYTFEFPPEPMFGHWSVHLLHRDPIANDTSYFEVREYTLPTFEISFDLPKYVLPLHQLISGHIIAKHHYGKPIRGKAQFKFGLRESSQSPIRWVARSNIKEVDSDSGKVEFKLASDRIKSFDWFPTIAGSRFVIEASVTETTSGQTEIAQDSSTMFVSSPYRISFEDSIVDFKPGMQQVLSVQLNDIHSGKPARANLKLEASYKDQNDTQLNPLSENLTPEAYTDSMGRANFKLGPIKKSISALTITIKGARTASLEPPSSQLLDLASLLPGETHTLIKHESDVGWIMLLNKTQSDLKVGDIFESDLMYRDSSLVSGQKIFYIIVARSQILTMRPLDKDGFVRFRLTEQMVPRIRIVLFAATGGAILSDSMRLSVSQDLSCGMRAQFKPVTPTMNNNNNNSPLNQYLPDTSGVLEIEARKGDLISLIGVDSAVYSLHNRTRAESARILERIRRLDAGCGFGGGRNSADVFLNAGLMLENPINSDSSSDSSPGGLNGNNPFNNNNNSNKRAHQNIGSFCLTMQNQLRHLEDVQLGYRRSSVMTNGRRNERTKRDAREKRIEQVIGKYSQFKLRACCRLGTFEDLPQGRNCSHRAKIVHRHMSLELNSGDQPEADIAEACAAAYLDCCIEISEHVNSASVVRLASSRNFPQDSNAEPKNTQSLQGPSHYFDSGMLLNVGHLDRIESETLIRRDFRETWLFELVEANESTGLARLNDIRLPHSMTSWSVSAMALNEAHAMCFMRAPLKLITFKEIFVHLSMPYKVVQGEQIDLIASVYNYSPEELHVVVYTFGIEGICSDAEPGERSARRMLRLNPHSSQSIIYPIIPLKMGHFPIKIAAISQKSQTSDVVERQLRVVARGRPVTDEITFSLDPLNQQRRGKRSIQTGNLIDEIDSQQGLQRSRIRLTPMRETDYIVPQTQECIVSAIGDRLGNSVQTSLLDVENLIKLPHGCGEQVMIYMGPTLYTARYLSSLDKLTGDLRWKSIKYIQSGYKRILNFRQPETGAFAAFSGRDPSLWLTSFVVKLLCQTEKFHQIERDIRVDENVINAALNWLIDAQNPLTGNWIELNPVYHREMLGGILKEDALTSFVTISLNECLHHSGQVVNRAQSSFEPNLSPLKSPSSDISTDQSSASSMDGANHLLSVQQQGQLNPTNLVNGSDKLRVALQRAEEWLLLGKYRAIKEKNPYVLALNAYALSFNRPREATDCLNELWRFAQRNHAKNHLFWTGDYAIETSGYALSALIELAPLIGAKTNVSQLANDAQSISNWLSTRRSYTGAFESTQDTIVALEALSKLAQLQATTSIFSTLQTNNGKLTQQHSKLAGALSCQVNISNRTRRSIEFDRHNSQILQTFKLQTGSAGQDQSSTSDLDNAIPAGQSTQLLNGEILEVLTMGTGLGMMSVKLKYNVLQEDHELCHFNIDASIEEWRKKAPIERNTQLNEQQIWPSDSEERSSSSNSQLSANAREIVALEYDYLQQFSKPMLADLNLVYHTQQDSLSQSHAQAHAQTQQQDELNLRLLTPKRVGPNSNKQLATTRIGSLRVSRSATNELASTQENQNWASKLVSSIRGKLSSIFGTSTSKQKDAIDPSKAAELQPQMQSSRRNNPRRATQNGPPPPPLVIRPAGIPQDAKFNNLSDKLELYPTSNSSLSQQERNNSNNVTTSSTIIRPISQTSLVNQLRLCVDHISSRRDSEMAVIEIGILSGFQPNEADLKSIIETPASLAMKYELSRDRSMLVFYLRHIPSGAPFCMQFRLIRDSQVFNLQSGYIRVYEYYTPKHACTTYYTPLRQADPIETRCDQTSQICECATRTTCPNLSGKMRDLGQIQEQNSTSARQKLKQLVCSKKFDFVSIVQLRDVRESELGRLFKLTLKVKSDLRGNLTKIIDVQRQQAIGLLNNNLGHNNQQDSIMLDEELSQSSLSPLESLTAIVDSSCIRADPLLLHLAHPNQWRKTSDKMILFGRYASLEKRFFKSTKKPGQLTQKTTVQQLASNSTTNLNNKSSATINSEFDDNAQQLQYSTRINLDRDSIIHDLKFGTNVDSALIAVDDLIRWLTIQVDHEAWNCDQDSN